MKMIDLLNKITNGEEVPEKVKFGDGIYYKKTDATEGYVIDYLDDRDNSLFDFNNDYKFCFINSCLEYELEIIEDEKQKNKLITRKKLYELPEYKNVKLYIDNEIVIFDHIDGMYSYCYLENDKNKIIHINANTVFKKYKDGYKLIEIIEKLDYKYKNSYGKISQHKQSEIPIIDKVNEIIDKISGDE